MKTKTFDAVAKSRRWKMAVAHQTAGMTREQVLAFFNKEQVIAALGSTLDEDAARSSVREEPPER